MVANQSGRGSVTSTTTTQYATAGTSGYAAVRASPDFWTQSDMAAGALGHGAASTALDAGALDVVRESAGGLARNEDAFIRQLHYDVTDLIPDSAGIPDSTMWGICERLVQSLLWVATTSQSLHVIVETLHQVGASNWADGFPDSYYGSVAHALVQSVRYLGESDWSASTSSAWITYFMWIEPHLRAGAQQAVAEREAARGAALPREPDGVHPPAVGDVKTDTPRHRS